MPTSYNFFKQEVKTWFLENIPTSKRILDVGPGDGTYSKLLRGEGYRIDAVEIFAPYIERFGLRSQYDTVFIKDILQFRWTDYDMLILGDILEHLPVDKAQQLIKDLHSQHKQCLVAVPYMMHQDQYEDNQYEAHQQEDLAPEVMKERYPELVCLYKNDLYGYYTFPDTKQERMYVLYGTANYAETIQGAVNSLRAFSEVPIMVYMLNSHFTIEGALMIHWPCEVENIPQEEYIDRKQTAIYQILIQRPAVVKDALQHYAKTVAYIDADSVALPGVDRIFDLYPQKSKFPYFVQSLYDYFHIEGRGGADSKADLSHTLEAPACELFGVDQYVRGCYRQTGYFVAGQNTFDFLDEWMWMCNHPKVMHNSQWYAPFHEETICNVLLWKHKILEGLPYIYVNIGYTSVEEILEHEFTGQMTPIRNWVTMPAHKEDLLFLHGEKKLDKMTEVLNTLKMPKQEKKSTRVLFLAPHLSTGGMPAFLLKRIEALQKYSDIEIYVVEWYCASPDFVVQRNKIMKLVKKFYTLGEDKTRLIKIIKNNQIDVIHVDDMIERFSGASFELKCQLYAPDRTWRIMETCHDVMFKPDIEKKFHPDAYAFCTPYHLDVFKNVPATIKQVIQFPIENNEVPHNLKHEARIALGIHPFKKHVLNVGLWTKGKNQGEGLEIARRYPDMQFHFVGNRAGNFKDYWEPLMNDVPENVTIWDERDDVHLFYQAADVFMFNSTFECSPLALREAIGYGLPIIARNLEAYGNMFTPYLQPIDTDLHTIEREYVIPDDCTDEKFYAIHSELYSDIMTYEVVPQEFRRELRIIHHYVEHPYLEILGDSTADYQCKFYDEDKLIHDQTIKANHWIRLNRGYYTKWITKVWEDGKLIYDKTLDLSGQRVFINIDSEALGDTIAWVPYALEFQKKHNCHVIVSTFKNKLVQKAYPELEFVEPGVTVHNVIAQYKIGAHYNPYSEPEIPNTIPMQKIASNILGLEYQEIRPKVSYRIMKRPTSKPYVVIATNSTAGCKFWQKEDWQKVIDWLHTKGYAVINVSKERNDFNHTTQIYDTSLENTMNVMHHARFFIGLSSGLSWLAWAMEKQVVMISNFSEGYYEFSCIRPTDTSVCHGCWNRKGLVFDKSDWDWCPDHKGTERQWECQKAITAERVIQEMQNSLPSEWF